MTSPERNPVDSTPASANHRASDAPANDGAPAARANDGAPANAASEASGIPRTYDHALHPSAWWRGVVAIVVLVVGYLLLSFLFGIVAAVVDVAIGEYSFDDLATGEISLTPLTLLAVNLSAAALIALSFGLQRLFFGRRAGTLSSVAGRFRWRWLGRLSLVMVPLFVVYVGSAFLVEPIDGSAVDASVLLMLAVVLLTTPLQAAGEEYGARGLIQRSAGSWIQRPGVAFALSTVISGAVFAVAHFAADPWLIAYYLVFGVAMSIAARGTGGLEAPVLIHALNNVLLFVPVAFAGEITIDRSVGAGGPFMLVPMAVVLAAAALSVWWGRRSGILTTNSLSAVAPTPGQEAGAARVG